MYQATPQASPKRRGRYRLHPAAGVDAVTVRRVGDANTRGRLERNTGVFRLRAGLAAPGAMALADAVALVAADWARQVAAGNITRAVIDGYLFDLPGFVAVLSVQGIEQVGEVTPNMVYAWCTMPLASGEPSAVNSWNRRRSSVRSFFETCRCLGIADGNPAKAVDFPVRGGRYVNAFDDAAIRQAQDVARSVLGDTRTPCALALSMSGAAPRELANVTVADVDLAGGRVWLHSGGYRCRDRWVPFTDDWCAQAAADRVQDLRAEFGDEADGVPLVYKAHAKRPTEARQAEAMTTLLTRLLQKARLHEAHKTRAESIREWLAATVFEETGSVEQVALRLGLGSLDAAAHLVGHDWVERSGLDLTPPAHRRGDDA